VWLAGPVYIRKDLEQFVSWLEEIWTFHLHTRHQGRPKASTTHGTVGRRGSRPYRPTVPPANSTAVLNGSLFMKTRGRSETRRRRIHHHQQPPIRSGEEKSPSILSAIFIIHSTTIITHSIELEREIHTCEIRVHHSIHTWICTGLISPYCGLLR